MNLDIQKLKENNIVDDDHDWGYQLRLVNEDEYCGKLLVLENDLSGGNHYHKEKKETFIVLQGYVYLNVAAEDDHGWSTVHNGVLEPGEQITIQPLERHWMGNSFDTASIILEVSTHDEDGDTYYV